MLRFATVACHVIQLLIQQERPVPEGTPVTNYVNTRKKVADMVAAAGPEGLRPVDILKQLEASGETSLPHRRTVMIWLQTNHSIERAPDNFGFYRLREQPEPAYS